MLKLDIQMFAEDGKVIIGAELDTKSFEEEIKQTETKLRHLEKEYEVYAKSFEKTGAKHAKSAMEETRLEIEKTSNKLIDLRTKQAKLGETPPGGVLEWLKNVGKETEKNVKKVTSWALAIFGIRGAYMAVRNAMNVITAQDEQLSADITYMKNALAYTLEPIIRGIVNLMKQLMFYVAYIVKAWTGKNIFANANKGLKSATRSAKALNKELSKTTASFDEMDVINDTSSGGGSDTGGAGLPSFDLTNLEDMPIPSWLQWIVDHKAEVIAGLTGIAVGLVAIKLGIVGLTGGAILGLIVALVTYILTNWENIKETLANGVNWMEESIGAIREFFGDQVANIYETWVTAFKGIIIGFDTTINGIKQALRGIVQFIQGVFTGDWKKAWEGIKNIFSGIFNGLKGIVISVFSFISGLVVSIAQTVGYTIADTFKAVVNGVLGAIENILNSPIRAVNKLIKTINEVPGIDLKTLSTFKLPRLAKGGIVNNPGPGVMMGSYVAGEQGPEAVLPLTDEVLDRLGEAIARHQNINATIPVYVGNRQIARELRKINAEDNFAFNN